VTVTGVVPSTNRDREAPTRPSSRPPPRVGPFRAAIEKDQTGTPLNTARPGTSDFSEEVTEFPATPPERTESTRTKLARDEQTQQSSDIVRPGATGDLLTARVVGIDFGGRWLRVGVLSQTGELELIQAGSSPYIPALVAVRSEGTLAAAGKAYSIWVDDPARGIAPRTVLRALRSGQIEPALRDRAFVENGKVFVRLGERAFSLHDLLVELFSAVRAMITAQVGDEPLRAIVSVPSDLDPEARTLLKEASRDAKVTISKLISEPEALIRAYKLEDQPIDTMLMVDVGVTHVGLAVARRGRDGFAIVGSRWIEQLSATEIDSRVVELTLAELQAQAKEDHTQDPAARLKLLEAVERARQDVRGEPTIELKVTLPAPGGASNVGVERSIKLSRSRIYQVTEEPIREITNRVQELLREVGIHPRALGAVVLAGSAGSYAPLVQALQALTTKEPLTSVPPAHAFVLGLARSGAAVERSESSKRPDVLAESIGIELPGERFKPLIKAGERLPIRLTRKHATTRDNQTEIELQIYQGEAETTKSCTHLGTVVLKGVPKAPKGVQVDLQIEIDIDQVATVSMSEPGGAKTRVMLATKQTPDQRRAAVAAQRAALEAAEKDKPQKKGGLLSRLLGRS
jgi:molecular chaperone DnaK